MIKRIFELVISSALVCTIIIAPTNVNANYEQREDVKLGSLVSDICLTETSVSYKDYSDQSLQNLSFEKMKYELGENSPYEDKMLTYTLNDRNEFVRVDTNYSKSSIAVFVGGVFVGYIFSTVVDGIIISATGQSGAWWVAQAISRVLNKPSTSSVGIDCSVYPPNSYDGAMCRSY